jgi:S1-C subfamily serine protease
MRRLFLAALVLPCLAGGPAHAGYDAGVAAWESYDYVTAYRELLPVAERGDRQAQSYLGRMYYYGHGVPQDYEKAFEWFKKAADQGHADAQGFVADLYYFGRGVPQNYAEAARWYRRAADQDDDYGKLSLGIMYTNGEGVEQDYAQGVKLFRELADKGSADAERQLGLAYENGQGVSKSAKEALAWYRKGADQDDPYAFEELGRLYENGIGVKRDLLQAYAWWSLAAAKLAPGSDRDTAVSKRDEIGSELTMTRLAEAQQLALAWRPGIEMARSGPAGSRSEDGTTNEAVSHPGALEAKHQAESSGTGIVVSAAGDVLTANHVVEDCAEVHVQRPGSPMETATLVDHDEANDLALLRLPDGAKSFASFRGGKGVRVGDGVMVVGYPLLGILSDEASVATGVVSALSGEDNDSRFLQITAPVQSGNSGGPLVDGAGDVVGLVTSKLDAMAVAQATGDVPQNVNFAVKESVAQSFLDSRGIEASVDTSAQALDAADLADRVRQFTVLVECWN